MNGFHPARKGNNNNGNGNNNPHNSSSRSNRDTSHNSRVRFPAELEVDDDYDALDFIVGQISGLFFGGIASICLLGVLTILAILYVVVRPFSVSAYRRVANQLAAASFLDAIALLLPNMRLYLTGDSDVPSPVGTSILVCNHVMDGDWWPVLMLGRCVGLRGSVKAMLRNEILNLNVQNNTPSSISGNDSASSSSQERRSVPQHHHQLTPSLPKQATAVLGEQSITNVHSSSPTSSSQTCNGFATRHDTSRDLRILAKLLHAFMEFPLLNGEDYISDREHLFQLLRSFAENNGAEAPVHLLFFPEGWSLHNGADRKKVLAMSNEFAKREGRPQLKHLLLPKTTGFNASLECLRESSPVLYDVTMVSHNIRRSCSGWIVYACLCCECLFIKYLYCSPSTSQRATKRNLWTKHRLTVDTMDLFRPNLICPSVPYGTLCEIAFLQRFTFASNGTVWRKCCKTRVGWTRSGQKRIDC